MLKVKVYLVILIVSVMLTRWMTEAFSNVTEFEEEDEVLDNMDFEEFKSYIKRYRRLIPYMSSYIANNYVNNQGQSYERDELPSPEVLRQPQRLRPRPLNNFRQTAQRTTTLLKAEKFIPSVQYDPKNVREDADYFRPLQYNTKANNHDDYYREYERRPSYPEITTQNIQESRFYDKKQPQRSQVVYNPIYERDFSKPKVKHPQADYLVDYVPRQNQPDQDYYHIEGFEPVRYVKIEPPPHALHHQHQRLVSINSRQPTYEQNNHLTNNENIIKSLQLTNQLPEMLNRNNIDSSIKTLVEILSLLHGKKPDTPGRLSEPSSGTASQVSYEDFKQQYVRPKVVTETRYPATPSTPSILDEEVRFNPATSLKNNGKFKASSYSIYTMPKAQNIIEYYTPTVQDIDGNGHARYDNHNQQEERHRTEPINVGEQLYNSYGFTKEIDETTATPTTTEMPMKHFKIADKFLSNALNIPSMAIKYGATRGEPNIDYPAYASIPETDFNCKNQRYKGFFGDPSAGCQVWHYCDLNGGKSSFLCPNGTTFSQAALTCDWWFNVKCESTTQLYVLNERLYKFILPVMPKFPEDFSGPEVDRYLELKFKEMEAKMKEKKLKKAMEKKTKEKAQSNNSE